MSDQATYLCRVPPPPTGPIKAGGWHDDVSDVLLQVTVDLGASAIRQVQLVGAVVTGAGSRSRRFEFSRRCFHLRDLSDAQIDDYRVRADGLTVIPKNRPKFVAPIWEARWFNDINSAGNEVIFLGAPSSEGILMMAGIERDLIRIGYSVDKRLRATVLGSDTKSEAADLVTLKQIVSNRLRSAAFKIFEDTLPGLSAEPDNTPIDWAAFARARKALERLP
jgi:hypothetical protein